MRLSNLSSLSLPYRSSISRQQPTPTGVFSLVKYVSSLYQQQPQPPSVAHRHVRYYTNMYALPKTKMDQRFHVLMMEALYGEKVTTSQSDVAMTITKRLLQTEGKNTNLVFSPLSIHILLSLIAAGSNGPTLDQLLSFLKSNSIDQLNQFTSEITSMVLANGSKKGGPRLSFASGVWLDRSLSPKPSFKHLAQTAYKANIAQADFKNKADEVISEVNSWAEKHTNGIIKEILGPKSIGSSTMLIMANALYFKAAWEQKFAALNTKEYKFYLLDGNSVMAPFMHSSMKQYVAAFEGFKVLAMPYEQGHDQRRHFSMYIFLPDEKDGLASLIEKLDSEPGFIDRHIPYEKREVQKFMIPKFKISFGVELTEALKGLGLTLPFHGGLTEMVEPQVGAEDPFVSVILQKSFIEVNEQGTDAAAVSVSRMLGRCPSDLTVRIDFVADHPFLYVLRENTTGTLLFVGQLLNPLVSK